MSIITGIIVILIAGYTPAFVPIGIYWPLLLVGIPSAVLGISGKINIVGFIVGILLGSSFYIALNFATWAQLSVLIAFLQLMPTTAAIIIFSIFWAFSPVKTHNKANQRGSK